MTAIGDKVIVRHTFRPMRMRVLIEYEVVSVRRDRPGLFVEAQTEPLRWAIRDKRPLAARTARPRRVVGLPIPDESDLTVDDNLPAWHEFTLATKAIFLDKGVTFVSHPADRAP